MSEVFERLREERDRLGMNQADFAELAGVTKRTQANYESGSRHPDTEYLARIAKGGANVHYIVTGQPEKMNDGASLDFKYSEGRKSSAERTGEADKVYYLEQSPGGLAQADLLLIVLDTLHQLNRTLPGAKIMALVDALMACQRAGMGVDKVTLIEQLRRVK